MWESSTEYPPSRERFRWNSKYCAGADFVRESRQSRMVKSSQAPSWGDRASGSWSPRCNDHQVAGHTPNNVFSCSAERIRSSSCSCFTGSDKRPSTAGVLKEETVSSATLQAPSWSGGEGRYLLKDGMLRNHSLLEV